MKNKELVQIEALKFFKGYLVTANKDGSVPINSRMILKVDGDVQPEIVPLIESSVELFIALRTVKEALVNGDLIANPNPNLAESIFKLSMLMGKIDSALIKAGMTQEKLNEPA